MSVSLPAASTEAAALSSADRGAVEAALAAARSPATRRAYASRLRRWEGWCAERCYLAGLPAPPEHVAAWLADLGARGLTASTVGQAAAAISAAHVDAGLPDPCAHPGVVRTLAGIRRQVGVAPRRQAHPLSTEEIGRIVAAVAGNGLRATRDRALILTGFAAALRRGELAALRVDDITWRPGGVIVRVRGTKTDQEGAGQLVGVARGEHRMTDPMGALRAWIDAGGLGAGDPLWPVIAWSDRRVIARPVGGEDVARILRRRAAAAGLGDLPISGHSLRAGHATEAAQRGVPADRLARTTRHRSLATLERYVRPAEALADTSSRDLGL